MEKTHFPSTTRELSALSLNSEYHPDGGTVRTPKSLSHNNCCNAILAVHNLVSNQCMIRGIVSFLEFTSIAVQVGNQF